LFRRELPIGVAEGIVPSRPDDDLPSPAQRRFFTTMKTLALLALASLLVAAQPALAQTQPRATTRISGVIAAVNGKEVDVTEADGSKAAVMLGDKTRIALSMPLAVGDIKPGSFIGAGAMADGKGGNTAMEITVFPESARGLGEGFRKWDQGPNSTMTNGTVSQVVGTSNRTLTVTYKGGQQAVTIPDGTPITTFAIADATALATGAHVVVRAFKADDGTLTAGFVTVGKDGFVPRG
jgi:hypothetical protein